MVEWTTVGLAAAEAASGALALATASLVGRSYRIVGAPSLRRFALGFVLLAVAQAAALLQQVLLEWSGDALVRERLDLFDVAFWLHYGSLLAGLGLVFLSFGRHPFRWAPALAGVLLVVGPVVQLLVVVVTFFVVLHAGLNHIARKGTGSGLVAVGFFLVFTAHTLNLVGYGPLEPRWWAGELVNLAGFLVLYRSVRRPRSVPDA